MKSYVFDVETYKNYFLARFEEIETGEKVSWEYTSGELLPDPDGLRKLMKRSRTIGFNSRNFDLVMVYLALADLSTEEVKQAANLIIDGGAKPWDIEREFGIKIPRNLNHIDLIEVAPGQGSLKIYGGRIHFKKMQDLPIEPHAILTPEEIEETYEYCGNDLGLTKALYLELKEALSLRELMSEEYGMDLMSKSDAQIAEAVIKDQVGRIIGSTPKTPEFHRGAAYRYIKPDFLKFENEQLQEIAEIAEDEIYTLSAGGKLQIPKGLSEAEIRIGNSVYRMGIGGLHSSEKNVSYTADDRHFIVDRDVTSYYPAIIINGGLAPKHLGSAFLSVYKKIVARRIRAKRAGDKNTANSLKITINGSFGKFGNRWSALFSPQLLIRTTITGQLSLLMLIERIEAAGIPVVSANTDGVVIRCPHERRDDLLDIIRRWEKDTDFETEETEYKALYSRDVNNYIAIGADGDVKRKGAFAKTGLMKNPQNEICIEAAIAYMTDGTPVRETIENCNDVTKFVTVRTVRGGGTKDGEYVGKAIRWYYSTETDSAIHYKTPNAKGNHNKVPKSDGAMPIMEFDGTLPVDIDYNWYVRETLSILRDVHFDDINDFL